MKLSLQLNSGRLFDFEIIAHYVSATNIFCDDVPLAERMRAAIVNAAGKLAIDNPKYVMRITGDSAEGKAELDSFINVFHSRFNRLWD